MNSVLILEPVPAEIEELIRQRKALGQDSFDEVWEGVYHMSPGPNLAHAIVELQLARVLAPLADAAGLTQSGQFNLGEADDYRVPDGGYHRGQPSGIRVATAAIVVEILSPGDETYDKFAFYASHGVEELIVADPATRLVEIWSRQGSPGQSYTKVTTSAILQVAAGEIEAAITWPTA